MSIVKRDIYFDNAKFILILLVVFGHLLETVMKPSESGHTSIDLLYTWIYTFHMPLFIFISGYFSKGFSKDSNFYKKIISLIVTYLIAETIYSLIFSVITVKPDMSVSYFVPTWIMWFLFSLIIWKATLPYVTALKHPMVFVLVLGVIAGFMSDISYFASLSRTIVFYPLFLAGYYIERERLFKWKTIQSKVFSLIWLVLLVLIIKAGFMLIENPVTLKALIYGSVPYEQMGLSSIQGAIMRIVLYIIIFVTSAAVLCLIPQKEYFWSHWGQKSFYVFIIHGVVVKVMQGFGLFNNIDTLFETLFLVPIAIALTALLSSRPVERFLKPFMQPNVSFLFREK